MTFDRLITVTSVAVAVIASVAASVQSYVSWRGRNDPLISAVLAEVAKDCHDIAIEAWNSVAKTVPADYTQHLMADAASLDMLIDAIDSLGRLRIRAQVEKFLDDEFDRAVAKNDKPAEKSEAFKQEVEFRFMVNLNDTCTEIIKKKL